MPFLWKAHANNSDTAQVFCHLGILFLWRCESQGFGPVTCSGKVKMFHTIQTTSSGRHLINEWWRGTHQQIWRQCSISEKSGFCWRWRRPDRVRSVQLVFITGWWVTSWSMWLLLHVLLRYTCFLGCAHNRGSYTDQTLVQLGHIFAKCIFLWREFFNIRTARDRWEERDSSKGRTF